MKSAVYSISYSLFQITQGLVFHPYQTMQPLVKDRVFVWMCLIPSFTLAFVTVAWRWAVVPMVQLFFSCTQAPWGGCGYLSFFSNALTFFCLYWQSMLLYLLFRFKFAFSS